MCSHGWGSGATIMCVALQERAPTICPVGHRLIPNRVLVGWIPCDCTLGAGGHRTWTCGERAVEILEPSHTGPVQVGVQWPAKEDPEGSGSASV